jgi:hypothetical protein
MAEQDADPVVEVYWQVNPSLRQVVAAARGEPEPAPWWSRWTR